MKHIIVLKTNQKGSYPYGIRNDHGFVLFFVSLGWYEGQEERYRKELIELFETAEKLCKCLNDE